MCMGSMSRGVTNTVEGWGSDAVSRGGKTNVLNENLILCAEHVSHFLGERKEHERVTVIF